MVLVVLSVVEQRHAAVLEVLRDGVPVTEVARRYEVTRQTVHRWLRQYAAEGLAGLVDRPMALWRMDIVGRVVLADGSKASIVSGLDDYSRFVISARAVGRATARPVCDALAASMRAHGVPGQILTDNGKVFTNRFGPGTGEVLFDRICRENGIDHILTKPRSPTTTGKVERWHKTLRRQVAPPAPTLEPERRRPSASAASVTRKVDTSGNVSFAGVSYRVGNRSKRRQVQVAVVGDTVEISIGEELIKAHQARHDRTREHGALANPGGRPSRINAA